MNKLLSIALALAVLMIASPALAQTNSDKEIRLETSSQEYQVGDQLEAKAAIQGYAKENHTLEFEWIGDTITKDETVFEAPLRTSGEKQLTANIIRNSDESLVDSDSIQIKVEESEEESEAMRDLLPFGSKGELIVEGEEHTIEAIRATDSEEEAVIRKDGETRQLEIGETLDISGVEFEVIDIRSEGIGFEVDTGNKDVRFGETSENSDQEDSNQETVSGTVSDILPVGTAGEIFIEGEKHTVKVIEVYGEENTAEISIDGNQDRVEIGDTGNIAGVEIKLVDVIDEDRRGAEIQIDTNGQKVRFGETNNSDQEESSETLRDLLPVGTGGEVFIDGEEHVIEAASTNQNEEEATIRIDGELESIDVGESIDISGIKFKVAELRDQEHTGIVFEINPNGQEVRFGDVTQSKETKSSVEQPVETEGEEVEIEVEPENLEPGEETTANAIIEDSGNLSYNWRLRNIVQEDTKIIEDGGESITFRVKDLEKDRRGSIGVKVEKNGRTIGTKTINLEYSSFNPDVDEMNVNYSTDEVSIKATAEKLSERPVVFLGQSINPLSEVRLHPVNIQGGTELKIEETNDYTDAPSNLEVHNVMEFDGENINGLRTELRSDISHEWLKERNLITSRREADISYYKVTENGWEKIPSEFGYTEADNHLRLRSKPVETATDEYLLKGEKTIAIAGDTNGITNGRYIETSQGECREIEEGQTIPPGWEEISVTCNTVEQAERVEETIETAEQEIQKTKTEIQERNIQPTTDQQERLNELEKIVEEARTDLENYRVYEARTKLEENREKMSNLQDELMRASRSQSSGENRLNSENIDELVESIQKDLPEELKGNYTHPEQIQEKKDRVEELKEAGNNSEARELQRELVDELEQTEEFQRLETKAEVYKNIEDYKQRDQFDTLDNETQQELYTAENQLYNGSIEEAEQTLNSFEKSAEIQIFSEIAKELLQDEEIRNAVQDILSEIIPGV